MKSICTYIFALKELLRELHAIGWLRNKSLVVNYFGTSPDLGKTQYKSAQVIFNLLDFNLTLKIVHFSLQVLNKDLL